ncbi:MAG: O-antigen ligase family protein [Deltaproteobacteria bacterium]|nr:O-antigen ligase family protein [Deltaproteobacteria bacterium]
MQGWAVTIIQMVTLIALSVFLLDKTLTWNWKWIKTPLDKPILILLILLILSTIFSVRHQTSIWSFIQLLNYLTIFYLVIHTVRTRVQFKQIIYLIIGVATFLSVFGLFKKFGVNPFPWWEYPYCNYGPRLTSTYGCPNHLAGYLEMAIPVILGLFLLGYRTGKVFILSYLTLLILTALILSLSRGGWIGSLIGLTFMALVLLTNRYFTRKKLIAALAGGFLAAAFIVLASTPVVERIRTLDQKTEVPNFKVRVKVWGGVVEMIKDHPLLGTGPGTFSTIFTQYQPPGIPQRYFMAHNDYLHFTSEAGLPLIAVIIWMIIALYRKGFRKMQNPSRLIRGITIGAMTGITAILVHSISDFNLHIPANAILFTVLAAFVVAPSPIDNGQ